MDAATPLLAGRTAVVTGAGAGIGKGIALGFAAFGARVAILEVDAESGERTATAVRACGAEALAVATDVRDGDAVARALATVDQRLGPIDVLVNNVGGTFTAPFVETSEKGWDALVRMNLKTVLHGTRAVAPGMVERGRGSIINVVSIEAERAAPGYAVYAACKAAVVSFTRSMALELGPHGVRVNALAPDICLTEGLERLVSEADQARWPSIVPLGRAGVPADVAGAAIFLASDLAAYVTGVTLPVDGGTHAAAGWYRADGDWTIGPPRR